MISSYYAAALALLLIQLAMGVIRLRRQHQVRLGDGDHPDLQAAIRAQANAAEYIPLALVLLVVLELNGGHWLLLHLAGLTLVIGRILHARALATDSIRLRVLGMQCTLFPIIGLALACVGYAALG